MESKLLFVYGILKRGFPLDLEREGCKFLGEAVLQGANIYHIGSGVGLRIEDEGKVYGEVFKIPDRLWRWLDSIEGHPYNYRREIAEPILYKQGDAGIPVEAYIYVHQHPQYFNGLIESGRFENAHL